MLTLSNLKPTRIAKGISRPQLSALADISTTRLKALELREAEPWFDEAVLLHRVLGVTGIYPLIVSGDLTALPDRAGLALPNDADIWRRGGRAPLSLAVRLTLAWGLSDPAELAVSALTREIWHNIESNDRHPEAPGWCPWCGVDRFPLEAGEAAAHLPTCLPNNLWARERETADTVVQPVLRPASRGEGERGVPAHGLKGLRIERELLQRQVADVLGVHANHYARIERAEVPLTRTHAERLAAAWEVPIAVLYAKPDEPELELS